MPRHPAQVFEDFWSPWLKVWHIMWQLSDMGFVRVWPVEDPWIVMRIPYGSVTGPAGLLGSIGSLRAPYGPVRLIVLVFPSPYSIHTVYTGMWALDRTGRVNLRVHAIPRPKIIRTHRKPEECIWPQHRTRVISSGNRPVWLQIPMGLGPHRSPHFLMLFRRVGAPYSQWLNVEHVKFQTQAWCLTC